MSYLDRVNSGPLRNYVEPKAVYANYPDFMARSKNIMLTQYINSANLKQYIQAFVEVFEDLEVSVIDTLTKRYLDDAKAAQLDDVGVIVGASRVLPAAAPIGYFGYYGHPQAEDPSVGDDTNPTIGGLLKGDLDPDSKDFILSDLGLKQLIEAKVIKNSSFLPAEDVIEFMETVMGKVMDIETIESTTRNAAQIIVHGRLSLSERAGLAAVFKMMKAAGVEYTFSDDDGDISLIGQPNSIQPYSRFLESLQK